MWTDGPEMKLEGLAEKLGWQGKTGWGGGMAVEGGLEAWKGWLAATEDGDGSTASQGREQRDKHWTRWLSQRSRDEATKRLPQLSIQPIGVSGGFDFWTRIAAQCLVAGGIIVVVINPPPGKNGTLADINLSDHSTSINPPQP
ncbi:uncharacterized protein TRIVIDRAFT_205415 [Trichoderma virens Gv29-8]|uniref:Uncharacterized protein n=1 Tax=Hypocrea virens (strain Gv29-8 / FGSC 10586) TaxID=413071 RepID=G9N6B6_HYPVG|nr:uncharacterized protein TRIVIDRAFT_205415 [Trichoderma virens Gv29-8]EHK17678.1 hypothetical protein TRIVIDRAFT_205415 [Trichoderma virens Gv29-8]UKZ53608.1 hypothetical protein TrVGV298_007403 [Trichoderma virens]